MLSIELEYPDLATCEREIAACDADAEAMELVLEGGKYRRGDHPGYNDRWQRVEGSCQPEKDSWPARLSVSRV